MAKKKIQPAVSITPGAKEPKTKIAKALALYDGLRLRGEEPKVIFKKISRELKISEQVARSYVWRAKNPEKFKTLLARYFEKRKAKMEAKAEAKRNKN